MKWVLRIAATIAALAVVFVVVVLVRSRRTFDAPYPDIHASADPRVIARGRYIVYGAGHCVSCHAPKSEHDAIRAGATPPLAGGGEFHFPLGDFYTPNLTPDPDTGIGRVSDRELARVLRYGVMPDGRATLPFMECHDLSDEDLTAIISYLRSQPPVHRAVPKHRFSFMGRAVMAFLLEPVGPKSAPRRVSPPEAPTVERGEYLANNVGECVGCHTQRSKVDGSYVGTKFAGGTVFTIDGDPRHILVTPNLTPSKTGRITSWSEEQFVGRFGAGVGLQGTHMPWRQFQRMSENDKRALYRYLRSLPPSEFDPGPSRQEKKKDA